MSGKKITRRQLARFGAGSLAASVVAVTALDAQPPSAPQPPANAELEKARASHRENSATLARFDIPQSTEPAFVFRA
jgi:hypothetical protein